MTQVIRIDRIRGADRFAVSFWLKPHLKEFVLSVAGGDNFNINAYHVVGAMALSTLTTKDQRQHQVDERFVHGRERITGTISLEHARREGSQSCSLPLFEMLVEHLFKHMMLVHVDARMAAGVVQNDAIGEFLDLHNIDLSSISIETLDRTMCRRRKRARANSGMAGKSWATVSPPPARRKAS